ncbi:hypothetical protein A2872_02635 [Candidatus Gottesmanbacteria bacterium RIFCSPHIGHO2_01_FULL_42_12]|uniref:Polymerase nucleotidyl transferase domain-containing protein n=1 Tax=Candidatus Gottesmanbacteria bacterium RIFCSPHIGHO2_01_FULL_42_12 TaxID=1798377 RepID=A0A1F5Z0K2_9BACT|nr:MAG: hypothetical protein A2872_02635 [Candidatus Gottesmanbacteria bacterium RIFCSPHIGHO2_01_FULL_42_12]
MTNSELLAHVYASIFNYPLNSKEAKLWRINLKKTSEEKLYFAKKVAEDLQKISFIQAVFVTGSVSAGNANNDADIDLMIVTKPGTLWLTRVFVVSYLKRKKIYKQTVCPNIFLDANNLEVKVKNLYTAHEVLQVKCLFDRSNINYRWFKENDWTKYYLPGAYKVNKANMTNQSISNKYQLTNFKLIVLAIGILDLLAFIVQFLFMKRKMTNESVGLGYAFFHPNNLSQGVMDKFNKKLRDLGIMYK